MPAVTEHKMGKACVAVYNTGTHATPTWVTMTRVQNLTVNLEKDTVDIPRRASNWKWKGSGQVGASVSFDYLYRPGTDAVFTAMHTSLTTDVANEYALLDGPVATSASRGLRAFFTVAKMTQEQPIGDAVKFAVDLALTPVEEASALVEPDWYVVP